MLSDPGFVKTDLMRHTAPLLETLGYGLLAMGVNSNTFFGRHF